MSQDPPQPPKVRRAARLPWWRWAGLALLAAVPALAVAGVFGDVDGAAVIDEGPLSVTVEWPKRGRAEVERPLRVVVANLSDEALRDVSVRFDPAWAERIGGLSVEPAPDTPWTFTLPPIPPAGSARIVGEVRPKRAGRHHGEVRVSAAGREVTLPLDTLVWP